MLNLATTNGIKLKFMSLLSKNKQNASLQMQFGILQPGLWDSSGFEPGFFN